MELQQVPHLFFDPSIIVTSVPVVFSGWLIAIALVIVSFPLAIPIGLLWSFMRMAKSRVPRALGATYINIVRGTPLFLQIYIAFFGLPLLGIKMDLFVLGAIVLVLNSSAYLAEIFRAGIQSINRRPTSSSCALLGHEWRADDVLRYHPADRAARDPHDDE